MRLTAMCSILALIALGCDGGNGNADSGAGTDSGGSADAGCPMPPPLPTGERPAPSAVNCPQQMTPAPEEQMGTCCWRHSNADQLDAPEMRLTYLRIMAPMGSLSSSTLTGVLNQAMQEETFNWLFRAEGADGDGPITITTGFGRRQADGTYAFSTGSAEGDPDAWCPVTIDATVAGETVTSGPIDGAVTVPIFDEDGTTLQVELTLRQVAVQEATWGEDRSCIGWKIAPPFTYLPAGIMTGFIEVEPARGATISVPPVETTVCAAIAGSLSNANYCEEREQGEWATPPDSLCDETGCTQNSPCMSDVCDPATTCNAWRLVAHFAAAGVDITNGACPAP